MCIRDSYLNVHSNLATITLEPHSQKSRIELKTKVATRCIYSYAHTPEASKLRLISRELRNCCGLDTVRAPERSLAPVSYTHLDVYKRQQ